MKDAIDYALTRQQQLSSWLKNPYLPIDNNQVERAIRPVTVGRKNCLFIGAPEAGQRAAIIYSMEEECKRTGTDFYLWLMEVLRKLPTYQTTEGYLNLLPGMLKLESPAQNGQMSRFELGVNKAFGRVLTEERDNCLEFMTSKVFKVLLYFAKGTMQVNQEVFDLVPLLDFKRHWSEQDVYAHFNLSKKDIHEIESYFV